MFEGTNLIQGKDVKTEEYKSFWFEYPARTDEPKNWETYPKTEAVKDKDGNVKGRRNVQLDGKDWQGIRPVAVKFKDLEFESDAAKQQYLEGLASEAILHLEERYPDDPGLYTLLRFATRGSEQDLRQPKKVIDMSEARANAVDSFFRAGGIWDASQNKQLTSRADLEAYFLKLIPDRQEQATEQAA